MVILEATVCGCRQNVGLVCRLIEGTHLVLQIPFSTADGYDDYARYFRMDPVSMPEKTKSRGSGHRTSAPNLEIRQLRAFVALIENGSVTAAAQALGLAQSTVSEAITALERELGTALVLHKRGSHTLALTPAGRVLLPRGRQVLAALDKACVDVAKATVSARGQVHIVANESVSTYLLSPVLAMVRRKWSNTRFAVSVAACPEVRQGMRSGAFDLGLVLTAAKQSSRNRSGPPILDNSTSDQMVVPLVPLLIFAGPAHPLAKIRRPIAIRSGSLNPFPVFVSDAAGEYRSLLELFFRQYDLPGPRLESTGSIEGVTKSVTADNNALGILPFYAVAKEVQSERFFPLEINPPLPPMQVVAYIGSRNLHPAAEELLEELRKCRPVSLSGRVGGLSGK